MYSKMDASEVIKLYQKSNKEKIIVSYNDNGEATDFENVTEIVKITKRHFKKGEFFQMTFALLSQIKDYKGSELKTLHALLGRLDFNNRIKAFSQKEIGDEIGTSQARVSEAIKRLKADKIIVEDGRELYFTDKFIKYAGDDKPRGKGRSGKNDET